MPSTITPAAGAAFQAADLESRVKHARVGCILALVLMPAGASLDWVVYPQVMWQLIGLRFACDVGVAIILGLLFTEIGKHWVRVLGIAWALLPGLSISAMILLTEGVHSSYWAGLILVMIAVCLLMPWTVWEVGITCGLTIGMYLLAVFLHPGPMDYRDLFNHGYFLSLTAVICCTSAVFTARLRRSDFILRWQVDLKNRELNESYAKLSEMDRLRSQFFSNISHELRTPLTLILAPLEDLLRTGAASLPGRVAEGLGVARQNALRLLKLINDLLELVRLDEKAGKAPLRKEILDLAGFASGIGESIRYLAEAKNLELVCEGPGEKLPIAGDPSRLEKVLLNLLGNAVKFTPGGGRITVRWRSEETPKERVGIVEVVDTGVGIPEAEVPHIFDRFRQVDGSSTRQYQGAGIGLSLVKELVDEHGGTIAAISMLGQGTTMRLTLPLVDAEPASASGPRLIAADPLAAIYRSAERRGGVVLDEGVPAEELPCEGGGECTVLVVDDEPDMRRYLVSRLAEGHQVYQSGHGIRAIEHAKKVNPDLVLLDLMLPGIDGLGVCRALRLAPELSETRIILLTARMDEASKLDALEAGADDFLTKPFSTPEVMLRVRTQLRTQALQRDQRRHAEQLSQALDKLKATEAQLVHSEKLNALGVLSAGLLHEINNPLNFSMTALEAAKMMTPKDQADVHDAFKDMGEGMGRIRTLVKDLGLFAHRNHAQTGERVTMQHVVELARRLCSHELKTITVEQQVEPNTIILGSAVQLSQVFVNLFTNAAKAMVPAEPAAGAAPAATSNPGSPGDGRKLTLTVQVHRQGDRVVTRVRDTGVGIKPEHLTRIFEPFFTTRPAGSGMGLGLSICHTIIAAHGGTVAVASELGAGTEFTIDLPAAAT